MWPSAKLNIINFEEAAEHFLELNSDFSQSFVELQMNSQIMTKDVSVGTV